MGFAGGRRQTAKCMSWSLCGGKHANCVVCFIWFAWGKEANCLEYIIGFALGKEANCMEKPNKMVNSSNGPAAKLLAWSSDSILFKITEN